MAVIQTGGGGGLLGSLLGGLGMVAPFVPGLQPFAPFIGAAGALANGNAGGAVGALGGKFIGDALNQPRKDSFLGAWWNSHNKMKEDNGWPNFYSDPVTGDATQEEPRFSPRYQWGGRY